MEISVKQDLIAAKAKHFLFKSKMRAYVSGSKEVPEEILANHNACALGKWISDAGKNKYSGFSSLKELDSVHQKIHRKANEIITLKKAGRQQEAEAMLEHIEEISIEIMTCIEKLENQIND